MKEFNLKKASLLAICGLSLIHTAASWAENVTLPSDVLISVGSVDNTVPCSQDGLAGCVLTLKASTPGVVKFVNIKNISKRTVRNIVAVLPPGYSDIKQNVNGCLVIPPNGSCGLGFQSSLNITHPIPVSVPVGGVGTTLGRFTLVVID